MDHMDIQRIKVNINSMTAPELKAIVRYAFRTFQACRLINSRGVQIHETKTNEEIMAECTQVTFYAAKAFEKFKGEKFNDDTLGYTTSKSDASGKKFRIVSPDIVAQRYGETDNLLAPMYSAAKFLSPRCVSAQPLENERGQLIVPTSAYRNMMDMAQNLTGFRMRNGKDPQSLG